MREGVYIAVRSFSGCPNNWLLRWQSESGPLLPVKAASGMHCNYVGNASRSLTQPHDWILYQTLYDPGIIPGYANQCILGNMHLRSNLSRDAGGSMQTSSSMQVVVSIAKPPQKQHNLLGCRSLASLLTFSDRLTPQFRRPLFITQTLSSRALISQVTHILIC